MSDETTFDDASAPPPEGRSPGSSSSASSSSRGAVGKDWTRRGVLGGVGVAAAAAVTGGSLTGCSTTEPPPGSGAESSDGSFTLPFDEIAEMSLQTMAELQASGELTSRQLVERYLERIAASNLDGPELRAVIEVSPDALDAAEALDRERTEGSVRGPLHGVPILLKDNIATADQTTTTAGSYALEGSISPHDSFVAARLRQAGAVLLGKANLSEWANFRSTTSTSGWSGRGGRCRNPYVLDRNPCGSSSGSGVAAAANLCAAAIGTETNGSIVCPASANGIVGIKPTVGLVSRSRIIPISHTQDTAGPMARTVADAALVLNALLGVDPDDPATAASEGRGANYASFLDPAGLRGARIGIGRRFFGFDDRVDAVMEEAIDVLRSEGAEVIDEVTFPERNDRSSYDVMLYEFKAGLADYFAGLGPEAPVRTLTDVIRFNEEHADLEMPWFGQEILLAANEKGPLTDPEYREALEMSLRLSREEGLDQVLRAGDGAPLDAIMAPTGGPAWTTDLVNGDHFGGGSSSPAATAGYPNVTVPAGDIQGLPVGVSFFGGPWTEGRLISIAYAFEQATNHRIVPRFRRSIES